MARLQPLRSRRWAVAFSLSNAINPGQSFLVVNPVTIGPLTLALGSMGAGGVGGSLAYQQTASFMFNAGGSPFLIDFLSNTSVGNGFDTAMFTISDNGKLMVNQSFANLASAQAFFSIDNLLAIQLTGGLINVQLAFNETMSGGEGFSLDYATASVSATPLPAALPLFLTGIGALGLLGWAQEIEVSFRWHNDPMLGGIGLPRSTLPSDFMRLQGGSQRARASAIRAGGIIEKLTIISNGAMEPMVEGS